MNVLLLLLRVSGLVSERWRESSEWMGGERDRTNNAIDGGGGGGRGERRPGTIGGKYVECFDAEQWDSCGLTAVSNSISLEITLTALDGVGETLIQFLIFLPRAAGGASG